MKKISKRVSALLGTLLMVVALTGCGSNASGSNSSSKSSTGNLASKQVLNWVTTAEIPTADSVKEYDTVSSEQIDIFAEGLYKINGKNDPVPALAAGKPQPTNSAKTQYIINLKKGLKWSNGAPLTANDFVFAWRRLFDPKTAAQNASVYFNIKNAQAISEGKKSVDQLGIKALSDTKLQIDLINPDPYFEEKLSSENLFPQNEKFVNSKGSKYGSSSADTLSNGPFVLTDWDGTGLTWKYVKNKYYWDKKNIHLNQINVQVLKNTSTGVNLFQAGKTDAAPLDGDFVKQFQKDPRYHNVLALRATNLEFGTSSNKYLQNENLRKAISLSINREQLVNNVLDDGSRAATGIIPKGIAKSPVDGKDFTEVAGNQSPYNKAEATQLWNKAKKELGTSKIAFTLLTDDSTGAGNVGQYLQSQIESALPGVTINISNVPAKVRFQKMMSYKFDLALGGWTGDFDPVSFPQQFYSTFEHNHAQFKDANYDKLIDKINSPADLKNLEQRWNDLLAAQKYLLDRAVVVPLDQGSENYLINPKVKGIVTHNLGAPFDITRAYLVK
ncbi:peptide ABC transporter substrate-binding protein [Sporolactobacillus shoreae]|uniref:Peptide ABC transporter substrate-binding protein n=1 Tax=Sporolactobacillus shoreae TaxID=1465501 RepID=A0A4Z0GP67_9BACL|nr:peptide ABC transporter substrate-binding protein [Sporolactobacillus shoreae]TGA98980.1 peptide ABC transporter substrate-binding protein [Sporolactobacillus shoreae]